MISHGARQAALYTLSQALLAELSFHSSILEKEGTFPSNAPMQLCLCLHPLPPETLATGTRLFHQYLALKELPEASRYDDCQEAMSWDRQDTAGFCFVCLFKHWQPLLGVAAYNPIIAARQMKTLYALFLDGLGSQSSSCKKHQRVLAEQGFCRS